MYGKKKIRLIHQNLKIIKLALANFVGLCLERNIAEALRYGLSTTLRYSEELIDNSKSNTKQISSNHVSRRDLAGSKLGSVKAPLLDGFEPRIK